MNWSKWFFYGSLICIAIALLTAYIDGTNRVNYYAGLVTGLALTVVIITLAQPGAIRKLRG